MINVLQLSAIAAMKREKMILNCSSCGTKYVLPPNDLLPNGRKVRCSKCGHIWHQSLPSDMPISITANKPQEQIDDIQASNIQINEISKPKLNPRPRHDDLSNKDFVAKRLSSQLNNKQKNRGYLWLLLLLIAFSGGLASIYWRNNILAIWPNTVILYKAIGYLPNDAYGLTIEPPVIESISEGGIDTLVVSGIIKTNLNYERKVPSIMVSIINDNGSIIYSESVKSEPIFISSGIVAKYKVKFTNLPRDSIRVGVNFNSE